MMQGNKARLTELFARLQVRWEAFLNRSLGPFDTDRERDDAARGEFMTAFICEHAREQRTYKFRWRDERNMENFR